MEDQHSERGSPLREDYLSRLQKGDVEGYVHSLSEEGLIWWFNMDTPAILAHLAPLESFFESRSDLPLRIRFLRDASRQMIPTERMEEYYREFLQRGDLKAASAAAGAAVASIWDSGAEFRRYSPWYERIASLVDRDIPPLAKASLYGFRSIIETTGRGDLEKAVQSGRNLLYWAEKARSNSLRTFFAASVCYCLIWQGRLSEAEIILSDMLPLCELPDTTLICSIYFRISQGFFYAVKGDFNKARAILDAMRELPLFDNLPPPAFYLTYGHLLYTLSCRGTEKEIDWTADKIKKRAVPEQNYFHHTYIHYSLGIAYLGTGMTRKALVHSEEALRRGILSESPLAEYLPALLYGQVLSELGRDDEAMEHLRKWIITWEETGFSLLASSGAMEVSRILVQRGDIRKARQYYERALRLLPEGEEPLVLNRNREYLERLRHSLYPPDKEVEIISGCEDKPVFITTFGDLQLRISDTVIYDRNWRGERTQALLKALIVFGGTKVSYDLLIDLFWPDTPGDIAVNNLKVTLSRLRKIGCRRGERPLQWILVKQKKISLARPLCRVDSILFKEALEEAFRKRPDPLLLMSALDLYRDDFLARDYSETWIIRHREILREDFIKATILLAELCMDRGDIDCCIPYLYHAVKRDPLNEEIYAALMSVYIKGGYPSRALQTYRQAESILRDELDISPGARLQDLARKVGLKI